VSKKSYTELKKREEELERENSQIKLTNSKLTQRMQMQEKKFKQLLEEKEKEIQALKARVSEVEQQRDGTRSLCNQLTISKARKESYSN
jgi:predicted site-specific integrase-resolvase